MAFAPRSLSATAIDLYLRCPAAYRLAYVERVPFDRTAAMWLGIGVHRAAEAFHRGEDALDEFGRSWAFCQQEMERAGVACDPGMAAEGVALVGMYADDPCPDGTPEVSFQAELPGLPVPLHGVIDLDGGDWFAELKTARYPWKVDTIRDHRQVALYVAAKRAMTGHLPRAAVITVLSRFPRPALARVALRPTDAQADRAIEAARAVYGAVVSWIFDQRCGKGECRYPTKCEGRASELEARQRNEDRPRLLAGGIEIGG